MTTMNYDEIKELISAIVSGEKHLNMPLGIITDDLDPVRKYLESGSGAKPRNLTSCCLPPTLPAWNWLKIRIKK